MDQRDAILICEHVVSTVLLLCLYSLFKFTTMANYNVNQRKFNWDSKEKLVELENFKTDATILFDGPYPKLEDNEKVSLVLNWLGRQATQIIKSKGIAPTKPKDVYTLNSTYNKKNMQRFCFVIGGFSLKAMYL